MSLAVGDGDVPVAPLLHVPDNLLHHHQVAEMRVAARHEPGEDMKGCPVPDGLCNGPVVPVPDNDAPAHEVRDLGEFCHDGCYGVDTEIGKRLPDIKGRGA